MALIRRIQKHTSGYRLSLPIGAVEAYSWKKGDYITITFNSKHQSITLTKLRTYESKTRPEKHTD